MQLMLPESQKEYSFSNSSGPHSHLQLQSSICKDCYEIKLREPQQ